MRHLPPAAPLLSLVGDAYMMCEAGYACDVPGVVAVDEVDGDLSPFVDVAGAVDGSVVGEYTLAYTVTNTAGRSVTQARVVVVVDTEDACSVPRCVEGRCEDRVHGYTCVCKPGYGGDSCAVRLCSLLDTDDDGADDCLDACDRDPAKVHVGFCGCGVPETDTDRDGVPDCADECPSDAHKVEPGACGCGTSDGDDDGDGEADCLQRLPCLAGWALGSKLCYRAVEVRDSAAGGGAAGSTAGSDDEGKSSGDDDGGKGPGWHAFHAACEPGFLAVVRDGGHNGFVKAACKETADEECWIAASANEAGAWVWPGTVRVPRVAGCLEVPWGGRRVYTCVIADAVYVCAPPPHPPACRSDGSTVTYDNAGRGGLKAKDGDCVAVTDRGKWYEKECEDRSVTAAVCMLGA